MDYLSSVNAGSVYLLVAGVLGFITVMSVVFLVKSYRAGIRIGMDKKVLRKTIVSSATFTVFPSLSILLGVIALMGNLGTPFSWLRLSVIGSLQYELNVADIAAENYPGMTELDVVGMNMDAFVTIALVMTVGILGGLLFNTFFLKKYLKKVQSAPKKEKSGKPGFGAHATTGMFVGLCAAYIGSYVGEAVAGKITKIDSNGVEKVVQMKDYMPLGVALLAALVMAGFEYLIQKKGKKKLEDFSIAASMLAAMTGAVVISLL